MLNDDDIAALTALIVRYADVFDRHRADTELKSEVIARLATYGDKFARLHSAFAVFGFDTKADGGFDAVREAMGRDAYRSALVKAGRLPSPGAVTYQPDKATVPDNTFDAPSDGAHVNSIRNMVIDRLKQAPRGMKATELRSAVESVRGASLHEKTIGMTLYRLSNDGITRREGRTWFFVPQEAKNPGGDTPGPINRDTKEGEEL